jgi:hypothetical protein
VFVGVKVMVAVGVVVGVLVVVLVAVSVGLLVAVQVFPGRPQGVLLDVLVGVLLGVFAGDGLLGEEGLFFPGQPQKFKINKMNVGPKIAYQLKRFIGPSKADQNYS